MPCSPPKARKLLRAGKAVPVRRTPFVIQLTVPTGETKQPITLGVDAGYKYVGLSATTAKEELLASEVELRQDVTGLLSDRLALRRARRNRKSRYRAPRCAVWTAQRFLPVFRTRNFRFLRSERRF